MRSLALLLLCLLGLHPLLLKAQPSLNQQYAHVQVLSIQEGLSQLTVRCMIKDVDGFVWIGTEDGLNRFDGYTFEVFRRRINDSTSLGDNKVNALLVDSNGTLWIGTNQGGLNRYDSKSESFLRFTHNPEDSASLTSNQVLALAEDNRGVLWVGTNRGLSAFDRQTGKATQYLWSAVGGPLSDFYINDVLVDRRQNKWVATRQGLTVIDESGKVRSYLHSAHNPKSLPNDEIHTVFEDSRNRLWIGTSAGLGLYHPLDDSFETVPIGVQNFPDVLKISEDIEGNLWVTTDGNGVYVLSSGDDRFESLRPQNDPQFSRTPVYSVLVESESSVWLGTYEKGIFVLSKNRKKFYHRPFVEEETGPLVVRCLSEDSRGNLWIGTDGKGLYKVDPGTNRFHHYGYVPGNLNSISSDVVKTLVIDSAGNVYAGHYRGGISKIMPDGRVRRYVPSDKDQGALSHNHVWSLCIDSRGNVWAGTLGGGISVLNPATETFTYHRFDALNAASLSSDGIARIFRDSKGRMWVGTVDNGVCLFLPESGTFRRYSQVNPAVDQVGFMEVLDLFEDSHQVLYVGTKGGGLYRFNEDSDAFEHVGIHDNLPPSVFSMLEDDSGNLWLGSNTGICKYNPNTESTIWYFEHDGVFSGECKSGASLRSRSGQLYFGGTNGYTYFTPAEITIGLNVHKPILTDLYLFHKRVPISDEPGAVLRSSLRNQKTITLSYDQNTITLHYTALDYELPRKTRYQYQLEGFDKDWVDAGYQRAATYTGLQPGSYTFKLLASNNDGVWSEQISAIEIVITPPFWQTWWFTTLMVIAIALTLFLIVTGRTRKLRRINALLEERVSLRTEQLNQSVTQLQEQHNEIEATNEELKAAMEDLVLQKEKTESINLELIRADEELKAINEHLDHIVHVRTADLVKANQELDRFVYSASHDLGAPLKSILGLIRLARLEPDRASLTTSLNYMERSVLRLDSVIRSLTQFSRNHGVEITLTDFSMNRLVDEVIDDLEQSISTCHVVVRRSFGHEAVMHSDFFRVKIILMNLLSNAIKFRKDDALETIVEIGFQTEEPGYTLSVTDYGIGIGDEHQPRVFEMFFRANPDREGSGLGLYIVNEMVTRLGGSIAVRSAAGVYTTFEVRLPKHPLP